MQFEMPQRLPYWQIIITHDWGSSVWPQRFASLQRAKAEAIEIAKHKMIVRNIAIEYVASVADLILN